MPITLRGRHRRSDGMGARVVALCRRVAGGGWLLAVLVGAASCNSVLAIREAELTCDSPPCELANPIEMRSDDATAARGEGRARDGGTALDGASEGSSTMGTGGAPAGSGASRDGIPVVPVSPPESADPGLPGSYTPAMGGSGAGADPSVAPARREGTPSFGEYVKLRSPAPHRSLRISFSNQGRPGPCSIEDHQAPL